MRSCLLRSRQRAGSLLSVMRSSTLLRRLCLEVLPEVSLCLIIFAWHVAETIAAIMWRCKFYRSILNNSDISWRKTNSPFSDHIHHVICPEGMSSHVAFRQFAWHFTQVKSKRGWGALSVCLLNNWFRPKQNKLKVWKHLWSVGAVHGWELKGRPMSWAPPTKLIQTIFRNVSQVWLYFFNLPASDKAWEQWQMAFFQPHYIFQLNCPSSESI